MTLFGISLRMGSRTRFPEAVQCTGSLAPLEKLQKEKRSIVEDICLPEGQSGAMSERRNRICVGGGPLSFWTLGRSMDWIIEEYYPALSGSFMEARRGAEWLIQPGCEPWLCLYWHAGFSGPQFPHLHSRHEEDWPYPMGSSWVLHGIKLGDPRPWTLAGLKATVAC